MPDPRSADGAQRNANKETDMRNGAKAAFAAVAAVLGLGLTGTALADGRHHGRGDPHRHWDRHYDHRYYGPVVRERVVVSRPVYVAPYYAPPVYPSYYYPPRPGIVVNVDIPPLVIPLR
jgi:hypothetical protein